SCHSLLLSVFSATLITSFVITFFFFLYSPVLPPKIHSFPTRRSSDLGKTKMYEYYKTLGLFEKTGVDVPGEANSIMHQLKNIGADRKSTRLNSSHVSISYAVFCLKKKK